MDLSYQHLGDWSVTQADHNIEALLDLIAPDIDTVMGDLAAFAPTEKGLVLYTDQAGSFASLDFWAQALAKSPARVRPKGFPYTLANFTAGYLARRYQLQGPSCSMVFHEADTKHPEDEVHLFLSKSACRLMLVATCTRPAADQLGLSLGYYTVRKL